MLFINANSMRSAVSFFLLCNLLSACSIKGSYTDASDVDAAKLRFISNAKNSTLDYFDAQNCAGLTTGLLNIGLFPDTDRRVDMKFAPPADADSYLEIKLKPGTEVFLRTNTNDGYRVCGSSFNFTPQSGEEYELKLRSVKGACGTLLQRLTHLNGKDFRMPMPMFETGLQACNGQTAVFPKPLPNTPQRTAMINKIVEAGARAMPDDASTLKDPEDKLDSLVSQRKAKLKPVKLPEEYWGQYLQNLQIYRDESDKNREQSLEFYKQMYRLRLQGTEDAVLGEWLEPTNRSVRLRVMQNARVMARYYENTLQNVLLETLDRHLKRMSQLDARFNVCEQYAECWQY